MRKKHVTSDQTVILNELDSIISKLVGIVARLVRILSELMVIKHIGIYIN